MLATFIIGLREGLEAALIVGIIAAFLRNNGKSLVSMWIGVALAVLLSIIVGVGLEVAEQALPQAQQEALETIIGGVAVVFVTGMIVWMNNHAREMKRQLESEAAHALKRSSGLALAGMAFLAVLKEGFETSVFLLATFSAAQSATLAAIGALLGVLIAVGLGWGIYAGGVRFNLSRFFRYTAAFLILVAAGLVIAALRTAHEAGWLIAGQQATVNLAWLVAPGTVQSALITGVLGIPADPRLIEVIGWLAYLVPVSLYVYWPQGKRPRPPTAMRLKTAIAAGLVMVAAGLTLAYPQPQLQVPAQVPLLSGETTGTNTTVGTAQLGASADSETATVHLAMRDGEDISLKLPADQRQPQRHHGIDSQVWTIRNTTALPDAPATLTLQQVVTLAGGNIPVGLNPQQHPGPFQASWSVHHASRIWSAHGALLDALGRGVATVKLTSSQLQTPRTFRVSADAAVAAIRNWQVDPAYVDHAANAMNNLVVARAERTLWAVHVPVVLVIFALLLLLGAARTLAQLRRDTAKEAAYDATTSRHNTDNAKIEGVRPHAAR